MPPDQLSTSPAGAAVLYRRGVGLLLRGRAADAIPVLRRAVSVDARCALADAALAVAQAEVDVGNEDAWRTSIERARQAGGLSRRDRQHVAVVALTLDGRLSRASALGRDHLHEFPGDAVVAHVLTTNGVDLSDVHPS